jgi:hypothetical protein
MIRKVPDGQRVLSNVELTIYDGVNVMDVSNRHARWMVKRWGCVEGHSSQ